MSKILPMIKKNDKKTQPDILETGCIGKLTYAIFKRGVIHISDDTKTFKKDCDLFEDEIKKLKVDDLLENDTSRISGSGDNCDLVFTCTGDDIELSLEKKGYPTIRKLRDLLKKGKK